MQPIGYIRRSEGSSVNDWHTESVLAQPIGTRSMGGRKG